MNRMRTWIVLAALALALGLSAAAAAESPTRAEYVTRLEAVCKPHSEATERATKGVAGDVRAERLTVAASKFAHAARIFGSTVRTISTVPRPSAEKARLAKWFTDLNRQEAYLKEISAQLRVGHTIKAQGLTASFIHSGALANDVVLDFGFNYCRFKFSRFS
jgi:hypothetical protein